VKICEVLWLNKEEMSKIKIAYIVNTLSFGGIEKYVLDLVNYINVQIFEPCIVSLTKTGPVVKYLERPQTKIFEMGKKQGNDLRLPFRMAALFRREKIDVIHSNNWGTFGESVLAKRLSGTACILHVQHGMELNDEEASSHKKRRMRNRIRRFFSYFADQLVTVSNAGVQFITKEWRVPERMVKLIYNGVSLYGEFEAQILRNKKRAELGFSEDDIIVGSVGRLSPVKNYRCLIKAFSHVVDKIAQAKLMLIGDGPEKNILKFLIRDLGLESKVKLLGQRSDVKTLLPIMDIFSLSSISEGISISILEAMSASLPVVVTNVGGNPEIVVDGKTGMLVESNNPEALANSIIHLLKNPKKRKEMGRATRNRVEEKFSLEKMVSAYEELYLSLLQKHFRKER